MEALLKKRRVVQNGVTRVQTAVNKNNDKPLTAFEISSYFEKLTTLAKEADDLEMDISQEADDASQPTHDAVFETLYTKIMELKVILVELQKKHGDPTVQSARADIRLPKLELPKFTGNLQDWVSFHDLFVVSVHNNRSLSGAQKLQYLKASLGGQAAAVVSAFPVSDANYDEAWSLLEKRFQHTRELVFSTLNRLLNQPSVSSSYSLRQLIDTTNECIRALTVLSQPTEEWDAILVFNITSKLDVSTRREWEIHLTDNEIPEFSNMEQFLESRARALTASADGSTTASSSTQNERDVKVKNKSTASHHGSVSTSSCVLGDGDHPLFRCTKFLELSVQDRTATARRNSLCLNCLRPGHYAAKCTGSACRKCKGRHNTLVHVDKIPEPSSSSGSDQTGSVRVLMGNKGWGKHVLLSTAIVHITDFNGSHQKCRALLDSGSQSSFITEECIRRLGLKRTRTNIQISGLAGVGVGTAKSSVQLNMTSCTNPDFSIQVEALILPKITGNLPDCSVNPCHWIHIQNIQLADPQFYVTGRIDISLGADLIGELMLGGIRKGPDGSAVAQETKLGWILSGQFEIQRNLQPSQQVTGLHIQCNPSNESSMQELMERFWSLEECSSRRVLTREEDSCERHFQATHSREADGRYTLRLPFRDQSNTLGESRQMASRRWLSVERRLQADDGVRQQYISFMKEYLTLGHMEPVPLSELNNPTSYYIPHHAVIKEPKSKFRVVFNASAKTTTGISLNDQLMVGPKLQDNLLDIVTRFRIHQLAFTAGVKKMYRQFLIHPEDQDYQRIIWRESPSMPLTEFRLKTVTYGTSCAPYLATKALQQLAKDEAESFPSGSLAAQSDFYVDDIMSSQPTIQTARENRQQLSSLMAKGKLELTKWVSNCPEFMADIPEELRGTSDSIDMCKGETVKTLGIRWSPKTDTFTFDIIQTMHTIWTKRLMLSEIAKLFDPSGWLAPVIIRAKILMQQAWQLELHWDDQLPSHLHTQWTEYYNELPRLKKLKITRCTTVPDANYFNLLGFSDASEKAYAACVYMYSRNSVGLARVSLLTSKTRVAPLKTITIPKLELCGAVLLATEINCVHKALKLDINHIHMWSDSTIVLSWIHSCPSRWKTFVANRVSEIQNLIPSASWHYVPSAENPADCASRGLSPQELIDHSVWWNGPSWAINESAYSTQTFSPDFEDMHVLAEQRQPVLVSHLSTEPCELHHRLVNKFSSWTKLIRVTAYCQRYMANLRRKSDRQHLGFLSVAECKTAERFWVKVSQAGEFQDEIQALQAGRQLPPKSRVLSLYIFLDQDGILRVGGRILKSSLNYEQKHPMLLPRKHTVTQLLVRHYHLNELHAGPQHMLASIQRRFWILGARDLIRFHVRKCTVCHRHTANMFEQMMANLPSAPVNPSRPFTQCGVDYAGPYELKVLKGRAKSFKAYICLFICFATRAIHIEAVSDATTNTFIAALHRFIARRGKPAVIHSDCGSNFVGANKELKKLLALYCTQQHNNDVSANLLNEGIQWKFNPPSAPHFGGLWEAGVKSTKYHLKREVGNKQLNFEEFTTLLTQIEAILNSRPLTELSTDPNDLTALTPGHFLIGSPLTAITEPDVTTLKLNTLSRWQLVQRIQQDFWKRWHREYLTRLQRRPKWARPRKIPQVGELVLVKDELLAPLRWKLARVVQLHPGTDGHTRVVTIKTSDGAYKRPIVKLSPLPIDRSESGQEQSADN